jgi:anti-sigma regulatory factor (Ser/Thr protein kinase)
MVVITHREEVLLRPEPESAAEARRVARAVCDEARLGPATCESAVLLTSEAVTNAIVHGRSEVRLVVSVADRTIRVEVGDDNSRLPVRRPPDAGALDGRGLALLEAMATRWGVAALDVGKVVWFELAVS